MSDRFPRHATPVALRFKSSETSARRERAASPRRAGSARVARQCSHRLAARLRCQRIRRDRRQLTDVLYPILNRLVAPYFVGKDARDLEEHLFGVYRQGDNYKLQGLALWSPVALVEFAILDLLGRIAGRSIGELLGGIIRTRAPFYVASGRRDTTLEQEIDQCEADFQSAPARRTPNAPAKHPCQTVPQRFRQTKKSIVYGSACSSSALHDAPRSFVWSRIFFTPAVSTIGASFPRSRRM